MKVCYISGDYIGKELPGVESKILNQISVMQENNIDVIRVKTRKLPRIERVFPFSSTFNWKHIKPGEADYLYIRMEPFSHPFLKLLKGYKKQYPEAKVIIEIATYPYDKEIQRLNKITQIRDKIYRKHLKKYVDRIVTYTKYENIFNIPAIFIRNGVNTKNIPVVKRKENENEIVLLAVASLQSYHGYERIIQGLHDYYNKGGGYKIKFFIVGTGPAEKELKDLVHEYGLQDVVIFFGNKTGEALSDLYDQADICIGSLGLYKRGNLAWSSALKTREYLARGLPMITGCTEDIFQDNDQDFCLEIENNDSPADIDKIIRFYEQIYAEGRAPLIKRIREFAENNVDVHRTFAPVIDYLMNPHDGI